MYTGVVGPLLASLGGASLIIAAFAHFLGKIWTDRIAKSASAKFNSELEILKSNNALALEEFKTKSVLSLKEQESFTGISQEFYQDFFKERVETYLELLEIKNKHIENMEEEFLTEIYEGWGVVYHSTYTDLRKLMIEKQLYISNDLETAFSKLRTSASEYIKEAGLIEAQTHNHDEPRWENKELNAIYEKFAKETSDKMDVVLDKIGLDVSKLRSRIEID